MNSFKLSKGDWSLANFVLVVVLIISAVPFVTGLLDALGRKPLEVETIAVVEAPPVIDPQLNPDVTGTYTGQAIFTITNPTWAQWMYALLVPLITLVVAAVCLWQLRRLMQFARRDDPFHPRAHLAVRLIGLLLFAYGLFAPLVQTLMMAAITTQMRGGELNLMVRLDASRGWPFVVGLLVGVVGEAVFGRGKQLAEEAEGLI